MKTKKKIKLQHGFMFDTTKVRGFDVGDGEVILAYYGFSYKISTKDYPQFEFFKLLRSQPVKFILFPCDEGEHYEATIARFSEMYDGVEFV